MFLAHKPNSEPGNKPRLRNVRLFHDFNLRRGNLFLPEASRKLPGEADWKRLVLLRSCGWNIYIISNFLGLAGEELA